MSKKIAIHWFRQDLRLADNLALTIHWKQGENGFLILCLMLTLRVIILTGNG